VEAVKPLDAEVAKPGVEEGIENVEMAADIVKQETQPAPTLMETTDQPPITTEASIPTSLSKPAARSKAGPKSGVASEKTEKKRIPSSNEVISTVSSFVLRHMYKH
jgi:hypothetical protein